MNSRKISLMAAVAAVALASPSLAISKKNMAIVDQYRDKIEAARGEPGVAQFGADEIADASADLPKLADALDRGKSRDVASVTGEIDTKLQTARTRAHAAQSEHDANVISAARADAANAHADAANQQANAASAQADADAARADASKLRTAMAEYQMKQSQLGATLVLQDVVFETGRAELKPGASQRLQPLATYLQQNPQVQVHIDGHTDAQGSDTLNQQLSEARAGAVRSALASMGVDPGRIQAIGHGKSEPVADNKTEAGRQQNRRVEVTLVGQPASNFNVG